MIQEALAKFDEKFTIKGRYDNFIGGAWVPPVEGRYFSNATPITSKVICEVARSSALDIELALDAAHTARESWGRTSVAERSLILNRIADRLEENLPFLALLETIDNGKPIRETVNADLPLAIDHFRYYASCIRAHEGSLSEIDNDTVAYHFSEPLGVVGQIIPWNFPSILVFAELIADLLPPGVLNVVNGFGLEAGKPLALSKRVAKIAFTGETSTGRLVMQYASENVIPITLELGGKAPNIFFADIFQEDDGLADKALEAFVSFALNQGEVCTCPSRALVHRSIYDRFMERALARVAQIRQGNPLDPTTMIGAQTSSEQMNKILGLINVGRQEGAKVLAGGNKAELDGELSGGFFVQPTVLEGNNKMRVFQEEIFGPVVSVAPFDTDDEALALANDTPYGLSAAVWTRDGTRAYRLGRGIHAGRVWINCYHLYPAHAAFGGYKQSGFGRETHKMMLDHYLQTKNILVSYSSKSMGLF